MNLSRYLSMDPHLLVGLLNTELRNSGETLGGLILTHDLDEEALVRRLAQAGYGYQEELNQFRPVSAD